MHCSDENMMDPYNLAICFGPTLVPIPEDRDQVQFQNLVNELIKNFIIFHEDIFPTDVPGKLFNFLNAIKVGISFRMQKQSCSAVMHEILTFRCYYLGYD